MTVQRTRPRTACETTSLADLVERILDKGIVISGDIKVKLVDVELLTIQIRLVICSVDKAAEIGLDWWNQAPQLGKSLGREDELEGLRQRVKALEAAPAVRRGKPRLPAQVASAGTEGL